MTTDELEREVVTAALDRFETWAANNPDGIDSAREIDAHGERLIRLTARLYLVSRPQGGSIETAKLCAPATTATA